MIYQVHVKESPQVFSISNNSTRGAPAPRTVGTMTYVPGIGFQVVMRCYEENPQICYYKPDDPVYKDSCMEVFLDCFPETENRRYLNVEMNAAGTVLCGFGSSRYDRIAVLEMGLPQPTVIVETGSDMDGAYWQVCCTIEESLLNALYCRPCHFERGHQMRGNFYKCGDEIAQPHWASWSALGRPDFHSPEYFGLLEVV